MAEEIILNLISNDEVNEQEKDLYEHHKIIADPGQMLMRLDKFLVLRLSNTSRNRIQIATDNHYVLVNGKPAKSSYKIKPYDEISIVLPEQPFDTTVKPENIELHIVHEDEDVMVINKQAGLVVHPGVGNWTGTLVNGLMYHFENLPTSAHSNYRPGLVHRIDKDTSGLMVIAKSEKAMVSLAKQFFDHSIDRSYRAIVWGNVEQDEGTITGDIGRNPKNRLQMAIVADGTGKHAVTHYKVIKRYQYVTLVECKLETGRTHQIRVHMKSIGHVLFNDKMYGGDQMMKHNSVSKFKQFINNCFELLPRQALHAASLGFEHPNKKDRLFIEAALPPDMQAVIDKFEKTDI